MQYVAWWYYRSTYYDYGGTIHWVTWSGKIGVVDWCFAVDYGVFDRGVWDREDGGVEKGDWDSGGVCGV